MGKWTQLTKECASPAMCLCIWKATLVYALFSEEHNTKLKMVFVTLKLPQKRSQSQTNTMARHGNNTLHTSFFPIGIKLPV